MTKPEDVDEGLNPINCSSSFVLFLEWLKSRLKESDDIGLRNDVLLRINANFRNEMLSQKSTKRNDCKDGIDASLCSSSSELTKHIDNLETLVVRLARYIDKVSDGDSKLADQAMGYIKRKAIGAQSILRSTSNEAI